MTASAVGPTSESRSVTLAAYRSRVAGLTGVHDELLDGDDVRPHHEALAATVAALGLPGLLAARHAGRRSVEDDGITYGSAEDGGQGRHWQIDPLPVILDEAQWSGLERGLAQRARLLDLVLEDVYGARTLLHRGVLPPEIVLGHPEFVHQVDGVRLPGPSQLVLTATDLGRDASGQWCVIGDRSQAPSGAGYAMSTRRITARVMAPLHRDADLARLRGFFTLTSAALQDVAPAGVELPRVVLLSPGAGSETAFDQAFLATLLGFPLVEADDLVVRDGRVWMRTTEKLEQVDVILRRVDSAFADPLELKGGSTLGVPGLMESARLGRVSVVNPIGSGVLENPGLLRFLPDVARALLGEDLQLPTVQTWWCGEPAELSHVVANLDSLVIKPIARQVGRASVFGARLDRAAREDLIAQIEATPWAWCAQEVLPMSTAPVVTPDGLVPRSLVLRTFGVAHEGEHQLMPGALGRVAGVSGRGPVSGAAGALAKDVWVLGATETPRAPSSPWTGLAARHEKTARRAGTGLAPRVAENLYWLGRYAERAEGTARILRVADDLAEDYGNQTMSTGARALEVMLRVVAKVTATSPEFAQVAGDHRGGRTLAALRSLVADPEQQGTIAYAARRLVESAQHVRDQLSLDSWVVLSQLERTLAHIPPDEQQLQPQLARVLESALALAGIMAQSMIRDPSWGFIEAGARLERAYMTMSLVRHALAAPTTPAVDAHVMESVLVAAESVITHRRRLAAGVGPASPALSAIDLLLLDPVNPRSVRYQLDRLAEALDLVGDTGLATDAASLAARMAAMDIDALVGQGADTQLGGEGLTHALVDFGRELWALDSTLAARHFVRKPTQRQQQAPSWSTPWQKA